MHVYVPLDPVYTYEQVRSFAELLSHLALEREPNLFTTPRSVEKRKKGRVYFDYLQISKGKTIAAPYVIRAYDGAPVATPLDWEEVKPGLKPIDFRIDNTIERFERVGDLFAPVLEGGQSSRTHFSEFTKQITKNFLPSASGNVSNKAPPLVHPGHYRPWKTGFKRRTFFFSESR